MQQAAEIVEHPRLVRGPWRQALLQGQRAPVVRLRFRQPSTPVGGDRRGP